jgi:hypothetical protein
VCVVNLVYRMTCKVCLGRGRGVFLFGGNVKDMNNFRQISSDTGHLLVCYHITFCIVPVQKRLHIYNSYDYDCDRPERLLIFIFDLTELEKYQVLFCF